MEKTPLELARDRTLRRLTRRDLSEAEVRMDVRRNFDLPDPEIEVLLADLRRMGLINDERLSRLIQKVLTEQGRGPRWIDMKLKKRGLPKPEKPDPHMNAPAAEDAALRTQNGRDRAAQWVRKRYPDSSKDHHERNRALAALARRGFNYAEASEILGGVKREMESEASDLEPQV